MDAASATGRIAQLRPPAPQLVLLGLTVVLIVAGSRLAGFREWLFGLSLRQIVALHLSRFIGIYFLVLNRQGQLPWEFAVPGGLGDIAVAAGAAWLVFGAGTLLPSTRWLRVWNLLGLFDIWFVVVTAARLAFAKPDSMSALLRLPLSLRPTFLVPLIIASHVLLIVRLGQTREPAKTLR